MLDLGINNILSLSQKGIHQRVLFSEPHDARYILIVLALINSCQNQGAPPVSILLFVDTEVSQRLLMELEGVFPVMGDIDFPEWPVLVIEKDFFPDEVALLELIWDVDLGEELDEVSVKHDQLACLLIEVL